MKIFIFLYSLLLSLAYACDESLVEHAKSHNVIPKPLSRLSVKGPLIGITMDYTNHLSYRSHPFFALNQLYIAAITQAGGTPVALPWLNCYDPSIADKLDGLILSGGGDVNPEFYDEEEDLSLVTPAPDMRAFSEKV